VWLGPYISIKYLNTYLVSNRCNSTNRIRVRFLKDAHHANTKKMGRINSGKVLKPGKKREIFDKSRSVNNNIVKQRNRYSNTILFVMIPLGGWTRRRQELGVGSNSASVGPGVGNRSTTLPQRSLFSVFGTTLGTYSKSPNRETGELI